MIGFSSQKVARIGSPREAHCGLVDRLIGLSLGVAGSCLRPVCGIMNTSDGLAAIKLQRGCNPHRRGFDNSNKAATCTPTPCFSEVPATRSMLAEDNRGERQASTVQADMPRDGLVKPSRAAGRHKPFRGSGHGPSLQTWGLDPIVIPSQSSVQTSTALLDGPLETPVTAA